MINDNINLIEDSSFAFATGSIRALERRLLDRAKLRSLIEAPNPQEAWQALGDAGYQVEAGWERYEEILTGRLEELYKYLRRVCGEKFSMIDWLVGRYDFHNLKALLKAHFLEEDPKEALINIGLVHPKLIEGAVSTGVWEALPEELASAGEKAALEYERTKKPQAIDLIVDAYMYAYLQEKTSFHPWLSSLMRYWCDLVNLKTALRIKLRVETVLNEALVKSGLLSHKKLKELFDAPLENWGEELKGTPYRDLLEDGISFWQEQRSLAHLEKLSDDFIIEQLKSAKFALYGVEPPVAYALAVEYEVKNIRIILVGKINGMSNEVIEERVRVSYV